MNKNIRVPVLLLRLSLGVVFFYTGVVKVLTPNWSAGGYLNSAKTFAPLYQWFGNASNVGWVSTLNEWGLLLIGLALLTGLYVRWASLGGMTLMALYYFPVLTFPFVSKTSFLVDEHVIYFLVFMILFATHAGEYFGLDSELKKRGFGKLV